MTKNDKVVAIVIVLAVVGLALYLSFNKATSSGSQLSLSTAKLYDGNGNEIYMPKSAGGLQSVFSKEAFALGEYPYITQRVSFILSFTNTGNVNVTVWPVSVNISTDNETREYTVMDALQDTDPVFLPPNGVMLIRTKQLDVSWATGSYKLSVMLNGVSDDPLADNATVETEVSFSRAAPTWTCAPNSCNGQPSSIDANGCQVWRSQTGTTVTAKSICTFTRAYDFTCWVRPCGWHAVGNGVAYTNTGCQVCSDSATYNAVTDRCVGPFSSSQYPPPLTACCNIVPSYQVCGGTQ